MLSVCSGDLSGICIISALALGFIIVNWESESLGEYSFWIFSSWSTSNVLDWVSSIDLRDIVPSSISDTSTTLAPNVPLSKVEANLS